MKFIHLQTKAYPVGISDIMLQNPNISYPDSPNYIPDGYAKVNDVPRPSVDKNTHRVIEGSPQQRTDGEWYQTWNILELSIEEKNSILESKKLDILTKRKALLYESDWTQLNDIDLENKQEWANYRKQLRDITLQPGYPENIIWPTPPSN